MNDKNIRFFIYRFYRYMFQECNVGKITDALKKVSILCVLQTLLQNLITVLIGIMWIIEVFCIIESIKLALFPRQGMLVEFEILLIRIDATYTGFPLP